MTLKTIASIAAAFAAAVSSTFAKTPKEVSRQHGGYPAHYCADTESAEARQALIAELWKHDPAADTKLWPEGKIPLKANDKPIKNLEHELWQRNLVVTDINDPFFTFFPAKGEGAKPVVVILPGGGYWQLGWNKEGTEIAEWLNSIGFSAAVLLYRAPNQRDAALCDVQRAIGLLRRDASKYAIDPGRVGVIGFSAGANLAISASTNWRKRRYPRVDDADDYSCRPDFQLPIYPWDIRTRNDPSRQDKGRKSMDIRPEYPVDAETPPAFIAQALDDFCEIETTVAYDQRLRRAGVSSTARIYANGGHGYGLRRLGRATDTWPEDAASWLAQFAHPSKKAPPVKPDGGVVWLDELPLDDMTSGWHEPRKNKSVEENPLQIGTKTFARGVGTHAKSLLIYRVDGKAVSFDADVGIDAEAFADGSDAASLKFIVRTDGRTVAETGVLKGKSESVHIHADLAGANLVELNVGDAGDGITKDHADWANAYFTMNDGARPVKVVTEQLGILTPPPSAAPRINGARVFGVRPGRPILWRVPVSGERPMRFSATGLPTGAKFDATRGFITGAVAERGEYKINFTAENDKGSARRELKLVVGDKIALTPQMGWCSWNCFATAVTAKNLRDMADAFITTGLADHGWSYVNVDDFWQNNPYRGKKDPTLAGPERTADGTIVPNSRFPDMKGLADYIHSLGLRAGLYSSPGPHTCGGCTGSLGHEWRDAKTYADWGFDYLKHDWCSYEGVKNKAAQGAPKEGNVKNILPYFIMGEALAAQNRDIHYALCWSDPAVSMWGVFVGAQSWRTAYDIVDTYESMKGVIDRQVELWPYAGPGAWNDPDMLILGTVDCGPRNGTLKPTRLTPNEQYTHMSLWSVLCAPLLIGCDLTKLDDFTLSLLTNDEVIETNQDELGAQAAVVAEGPRAQVWAKPMSDGSLVFALFNTYFLDTRITIDFASLGLEGRWLVRDLWRQKDLGVYSVQYAADVPGHATHLVRLFPREDGRLADGVKDIRMNGFYRRFENLQPLDKPGYHAPKGYPCAECPKNKTSP